MTIRRNVCPAALVTLLLVTTLFMGCTTSKNRASLPEPPALAVQTEMPDPLRMLNGKSITSRKQWFTERRPELQALFQHYMYGNIPRQPAGFHATQLYEFHDFLGGSATLKLLTLGTGRGRAPKIDLMIVLPNQIKGRAPLFLAMNFCGNHALDTDPRIPLAKCWLYNNCKGCTNNTATAASRGGQAADWPLAEIVRRGYGVATFCSSDVDSDRAEVSDGVYAWLAEGDATRNNPTNRGSIAAWAWGFHRCMDYLVTDQDVDTNHIAAVGHSRNGKAALLAAAFDDRIALAIPHQAGCGGSAPSRGKTGESVQRINTSFPHWFNGRFKMFNEEPDRLPFDQNCLVALCAPRPVLFSNAREDQWSNPSGQFEVLRAADPVYRLLGVEGVDIKQPPPLRHLVDSRLGYYIREGKHSMTADDWRVFMDFADHWCR